MELPVDLRYAAAALFLMMLEESLKDCCPEDDLNPDEPSTPTAEFYIYDSAPLEVGRQSTARINK